MSDFLTPDGYALGLLERTVPFGEVSVGDGLVAAPWDGSSESCPLVPRNEWTTQERPMWAERRDVNQGQTPSCCLASLANAIEFFLVIHGRQVVELDWLKAWKELTGGRGGAAIQAAMTWVTTRGYPIVGSTERLKVTELWDVNTADAYFSGVQRGDVGHFGHMVDVGGGQRGGHAEAGMAVDVSGHEPFMWVRGSWGKSAGENGWFRRTYSDLKQGIPLFGGTLIREVELRAADAAGFPDAKV